MQANILAAIFAAALTFLSAAANAQAEPESPSPFPFPFPFWRSTGLPDAVEFGSRIESGDLAAATGWLDRGLDPDFVGDRIGTGLMIAAWQGNLPMLELFAARGADINRMNGLGEQALMHAAWRGHLDAVTWLLARGATMNRSTKQWTALHYAAFAGRDEVVRYLVARGADLDARSPNGSTPLMMAVYEGKESTVRQLIRLGADRKAVNDAGEGAMQWAFKHDRLAIARALDSMEEFAAAASLPKSNWTPTVRSLPVTATAPTPEAVAAVAKPPAAPDAGAELRAQIAELTRIRNTLVARGLDKEVPKVDRRIAALRVRLAKPGGDVRRPATLEITAERRAPARQGSTLVYPESN